MQNTLTFVAIVLLAFSFLSATITLKESMPSKRHFWSASGLISFVLGTGALIALLYQLPHVPMGMIVAVFVLGLVGLLLWGTTFTTARQKGGRLKVLWQHLRFAEQVGLPNWQSLDVGHLRAEDKSEAKVISRVVNIGAALTIFPGLVLILAASIVMNVRGNEQSDFLSHAVGFYTLLIATCWTTAFILTILIVSLVQGIRGTGNQLTLPKVVNSLGTWAGLGAVIAVFVGALIPLVVVPLSRGQFHLLGTALLDSISPALLLDISTAGAVYGFLIGEVISLINISAGEENVYVKATLPPILFAVITTVLGLVGLTPGHLSSALANDYRHTVLGSSSSGTDPFQTGLSQGLDSQEGWANVVSGLDQHGWNLAVDHHVFFILTWTVAILVALFSTTVRIRKRELALLSMTPAATPSNPGVPPKSSGKDSKQSQ